MSWYKVELNEEQMRQNALWKIQDQFTEIYISQNIWRVAALYSQHHEKGFSQTAYLYCESPVHAEMFCRLFSMSPCNPPINAPKG